MIGYTNTEIVDGIILEKYIDGVPFRTTEVEQCKPTENLEGITIHDTPNNKPINKDVHFFVDDNSITQLISINKIITTDRKTIEIEISYSGNVRRAEANTQRLIVAIMLVVPEVRALYNHHYWSGIFCPKVLLSNSKDWARFLSSTQSMLSTANRLLIVIKKQPWRIHVSNKHPVKSYRSAEDALEGIKVVEYIPPGRYEIVIIHESGAWCVGGGYRYWVNPKEFHYFNFYTHIPKSVLERSWLQIATEILNTKYISKEVIDLDTREELIFIVNTDSCWQDKTK